MFHKKNDSMSNDEARQIARAYGVDGRVVINEAKNASSARLEEMRRNARINEALIRSEYEDM